MKSILKTTIALLVAATSATAGAQGLKDAYKDYFTIGVALNQRNVSDNDQIALIKKEFR